MGDENLAGKVDLGNTVMEERRICITSPLGQDPNVLEAAESFRVPVIVTDSAEDYIDDKYITYFILKDFEGDLFELLCQKKCRSGEVKSGILGPTALRELAQKQEPLPPPDRLRPMYSLSMRGLIVCFTGFRIRDELCHLASLIHQMGGSIRKYMDCKITHLVANSPSGAKYQYASTFNIPVMSENWVITGWENRNSLGYSCKNTEVIAEHKLKLGGTRVCFIGFNGEETEHMCNVLVSNRGVVSSIDDPECTHLVLDNYETYELIKMEIIKPASSQRNLHCPSIHAKDRFPNFKLINVCGKGAENPGMPFGPFCTVLNNTFGKSGNEESTREYSPSSNMCERCLNWHRETGEIFSETYTDEKDDGDKILTSVVDEMNIVNLPENAPPKAYVVKAEWFWASIQNELCADEKEYLFEPLDPTFSPENIYQSTPLLATARTRKRKRFQQMASSSQFGSPLTNKRRSSISDAGLLSISGSYLDCTVTPEKDNYGEVEVDSHTRENDTARRKVFLELVQTESNYVNILHTIISLFKNPLEEMLVKDNMILNATEVKIIFGNLSPIYDIHSNMLEELKWGILNWKEDFGIGCIILKFAPALEKAYPPFINYFEKSTETVERCDATKPRFHAFLKIRLTKPECGRQTLKELLIRPVQRLPSIILLLNDLLKHTDSKNPDNMYLQQALAGLKNVMTHINEDKRRTDAQLAMFDLFNEIDNCPAYLISSHRSLVAKCECVERTEVLSSKKGDTLLFLLFTDTLEVCKKRVRAFNTFRSTKTGSLQKLNKVRKQYKHIRLMPLSSVRKVIDVNESPDSHNVFALICHDIESLKDSLCSFTITDDKTDKSTFLKQLCMQMAHTVCTPDPEEFYVTMDSANISLDTAASTPIKSTHNSLSKAFRFATRVKVGRAFSMSRSPSRVSKRNPADETLTPSTDQLAQMRF